MQCWPLSLSTDWIISAVGPEGSDGELAGSSQQLLSPDMRPQSAEEPHLPGLSLSEAAGLVGGASSAIPSRPEGRPVTGSLLAADRVKLQCDP